MKYVRNGWYIAAWADELEPGTVLARTLLDTPVVLYRELSGSPAALFDRCPHRFAPLSAGKVDGGRLVCGYHGLGFDRSGRCVQSPHGPPPKAAQVAVYPVVETHKAIWIWMGDASAAHPGLIPDVSFLSAAPPAAFSSGRLLSGQADYVLYLDNLMDLSHVDYLHPSTLGGGSITESTQDIAEGDDFVEVAWRSPKREAPPLMAKLMDAQGAAVDVVQRLRWTPPATIKLTASIVPEGADPSAALTNLNVHALTPETETTTHYFFAATRNFATTDSELNQRIAATREEIFRTEDKPMIEKVFRNMRGRDFWSLRPALFSVDAASVRVRRRLEALVAAEVGESSARLAAPVANAASARPGSRRSVSK